MQLGYISPRIGSVHCVKMESTNEEDLPLGSELLLPDLLISSSALKLKGKLLSERKEVPEERLLSTGSFYHLLCSLPSPPLPIGLAFLLTGQFAVFDGLLFYPILNWVEYIHSDENNMQVHE